MATPPPDDRPPAPGTVRSHFDPAHPHVLVVTLDHPPVNAMTPDMYRQVYEIFEGLRERAEVRAVVLTGAGEKAFTAGGDVRAFAVRTPEMVADRSYRSRRAYEAVRLSPVPVVCAVDGAAFGAGFILATVSDFILATDRTRFALPEIDVGALGGARHAARVLPEHVMRQLILTGERVDAAFLARFGVIREIVAPEALLQAALALAGRLAAKSPVLMRMRKESLNLVQPLPFAEGYRVEQLYSQLAAAHPDAREAARAVAERRAPLWQDDREPDADA
ncbi:MAG: enoyl-CoA hydratase-related protein [Gammaproteobacteria bacterium]